MPKICREEDSLTTGHECTTTSTLDTPSQTTVFVEGKLVARVGDETLSILKRQVQILMGIIYAPIIQDQ